MILKVLTILPCLCVNALHIAGLGSSFAAGPGLRENYAQILAGKLKAELSNLSVSGSTLSNIGTQVARIPSNVDIVTITSGGNDLGYMAGLMSDSLFGWSRVVSPEATQISEADLARLYSDVLIRIHKQAPKAKIFVVEYLTLLGPDAKPKTNVPFSAARIDHHREVAATLQRATAKAAEGKDWVVRIPVAKISESHGIGSQDQWVNSNNAKLGDGMQWHPRSGGMQAIANMLYEAIKG